jgi:predicted aspartyl protease
MSFAFNPHAGPVIVLADLEGPAASAALRLALDTGATDTAIAPARLVAAGYDPTNASQQVQVMTGSGWVRVPIVTVQRLTALGQTRTGLAVLALALPKSSLIDGVLGLDFLRSLKLEIDFRSGTIDLK